MAPKNAPRKNNFKTTLSPKIVHKCIGTTLQRFKKPKDMSGVEL